MYRIWQPIGVGKPSRSIAIVVVIAVLSYCGWTQYPNSAAYIVIDGNQRHQTMDGFGGTEHWLFPSTEADYSRIFDELGASIVRFRMVQYVESTPDLPGNEADNDNNDPFVIDWSGVKMKWFDSPIGPFLKAAQSRGVKIFGNIMSPPPWMKTNNADSGMGSLKPGYEDEMVEFMLIWIKGMELYQGVHIDCVSFENEPNYSRSYDGCLLTASQIQDLTRRLGARLAADGLTTKIVTPEISNLPGFINWADVICRDSLVNSYIYRLATHSYNIGFFAPDQNISNWIDAYGLAQKYGKPLWLTEYCLDDSGVGYKGTWREAIALVQHVHNALYYGNVTAWIYHEMYNDPSRSPIALIDNFSEYRIYPKFYALKQYFRYIRPGSVRIDSQSDDKDVLVTAFRHEQNKTITVVMVNRHAFGQTVNLRFQGIQGVANLDVIRTSVNENAAYLSRVPVTNGMLTCTAPAESITTFTGEVSGSSTDPLLFPQTAVGGGYTTVFTLVNTGSESDTGILSLRDPAGNPFVVAGHMDPDLNSTASVFQIDVPAGGTRVLSVDALNPSDPVVMGGWARLESGKNLINGYLVFQTRENGLYISVAGVLGAKMVSSATIPVDNDLSARRSTAFAVANDSGSEVNLRIVVLDENGAKVDDVTPAVLNPLGAYHRISIYLDQILPHRATFKGSMLLMGRTPSDTFAAIALMLYPGTTNLGLMSVLPVIPGHTGSIQ